MKENCKIIQDLLPSYIENCTHEETNDYIKKHLSSCEECRTVYSSMKENIDVKPWEMKEEVKYMKKFNKQIKALRFIIIAILIFLALIIGRKTIIMTNLFNKVDNNIAKYLNNYHMTLTTYSAEGIMHTETYCNETARISFTKKGSVNEAEQEITCYERDGEKINLLKSDNISIISSDIVDIYVAPAAYTSTFLSNLQYSFIVDIENVTLDSKECYVIKSKTYDRFIDKETGLILKEIDYANNTITDYTYEFGTVKDSDVDKPDTTGYVEQSKEEQSTNNNTVTKKNEEGNIEFVKTYYLMKNLNKEDQTGDYNYYVIEQYQVEDPAVIKLNKKFELEEGFNYEFTFKGNNINQKNYSIQEIFDTFELTDINKTDKIGMEQKQDI